MKRYYYGSSNPNLIQLKTSNFSNRKIYMTTNKNYALMYATYKYINLFIDDENSNIKFLNIYPNLFENLYKNTIGYIYSAELDETDFYSEETNNKKPIADSYYTLKDVQFDKKEKIRVYDEFMNLKKNGLFEIIELSDIPKSYISDLKRYYKNKYLHNDMSNEEIEYFKKFLPDLINTK